MRHRRYGLSLAIMAAATGFAADGVALEATAGSANTETLTNAEMRLNASNQLLSAAISMVNKKIMAIETCMNKNMFYKPADTDADTDGCVGVKMSTETRTVALPEVLFDSYTNTSKNSKGWSGASIRTIGLASYVAEGAKAIEVIGSKASFAGNCNGQVLMNIAQVTSSYSQTMDCHYDKEPNRHHYFLWSYDPAAKALTVTSKASQTKNSLPTGARLTGITVSYELTKLVVGSGK